MNIFAGLIARGIGYTNLTDISDQIELNSKKQISDLNALLDIDDKTIGIQSSFYDSMDESNDHSCGKIDLFYTNTRAIYLAGVTTIYVKSVNGISVGQELSIFDDVNRESKIISHIDTLAKTITFTSGLINVYKYQAGVCRSSCKVDTVNKRLGFGGWKSDTAISNKLDTFIANSAYNISGNGGRKIVRLSNGWLVSAAWNGQTTPNGRINFYVSKDNDITWSLLALGGVDSQGAGYAICSYGTKVYAIGGHATNQIYSLIFDAATITMGSTVGGGTLPDTSNQTSFSSGCSIEADSSNGNLYASWSSKNSTYPNSFNIRHAMSTDGGVTWKKADGTAGVDQITSWNTIGWNFSTPCIVVRNSKPIILMQAYISGSDYYISSSSFTTAWSAVIIIQTTYLQSNPSAVVSPDGTIHVVWQGLDSTDTTMHNIRYSKSVDGGLTWSTMLKLTSGNVTSPGNNHQEQPTITSDMFNKIYVVWCGRISSVSTGYQIQKKVYDPISMSWSAASILTSSGIFNMRYPQAISNYTDFIEPMFMYEDNLNGAVRYHGVYGADTINYPTSVANSAYTISGNGGRKIVRLSNGWIVSALYEASVHTCYFKVSKDNGNTWNQICYAVRYCDVGFSITSFGTKVYALFNYSGSTLGSYFASFDAITVINTDLSPVRNVEVNTQTALGAGCSIEADTSNGNLYAAWCTKNSTYPISFNIRHAMSSDGGVTWKKADGTAGVDQITSYNATGIDYTQPCIIIKNSSPVIISNLFWTNSFIRSMRWTGSTWTILSVAGGDPYLQSNPSAVVSPNGRIWVTWEGLDSIDSTFRNIHCKYSDDGGTTWLNGNGATDKLTTGNSYTQCRPTISSDMKDNITVTWEGCSVTNPTYAQMYSRTFRTSSLLWENVRYLTNSNNHQYYFNSVANADSIEQLCIWVDGAAGDIKFRGQLAQNADILVPTTTIANQAYDISGNGGRKITYLNNGWIVAAAYFAPASYKTIHFYVSKDNGTTWDYLCWWGTNTLAGFSITSYGNIVYAVMVLVDGRVYSTRFNALSVSYDTDLSGTFYNTITPSVGVCSGTNGSLVCNQNTGYLYFAWSSKSTLYPNSYNIRHVMSTDGGEIWSKADGSAGIDQVTSWNTVGIDQITPCIIIKNNKPVIISNFMNAALNKIHSSVWTGSTWTEVYDVYNGTTYAQANPCAVVSPDGNIHVVWDLLNATYPLLQTISYSKSTNGGVTWSAPIVIAPSTGNLGQARSSIVSDVYNNLYVFFDGRTSDSGGYARIRRIICRNESWGTIDTLTNNTTAHVTCSQVASNILASGENPIFMYIDFQSSNIKFYTNTSIPISTLLTPSTVANSAYDISGNGGRKMVRLSNGWIVCTAYNPNMSGYNIGVDVTSLDAPLIGVGARWAQSFKCVNSLGVITKARVFISSTNVGVGTINMRLETDNAGVPSGTLANTNTKKDGIMCSGTYTWIEGVFDSGFIPTPGVTYHLVITVATLTSGTHFDITRGNTDYLANSYESSWNGSNWTAGSGEIMFGIYQEPLLAGDIDKTLYFLISKDDGMSWSPLTYMTSDCGNGTALSSNGTNVYVLRASSNLNTTVVFNKFDALTVTNTNINTLNIIYLDSSQTSSISTGCSIECDSSNGYLYAAWCSKNATYPNAFNIRHAKSINGGITWTKADGTAGIDQVTNATATITGYTNPCVVIKNGKPAIVCQIFDGTNYSINCYYFISSWSGVILYAGNTYAQYNPCVVVSGDGIIHVVWRGSDATDPSQDNIRYSKSINGGITWSTMLKLTSGNLYGQTQPTITADKNNNIYVIWMGKSLNTGGIYNLFKIVYNGSAWSSIISITSAATSGNQSLPQTISNFTNFTEPLVIWQDNQSLTIKFIGNISTTIPVLVEDIRYNIKPPLGNTNEIVSWIKYEKDPNFLISTKGSIVASGANELFNNTIDTTNAIDVNYEELQSIYDAPSNSRVTEKITMTRNSISVDKSIVKILGST